MFNKSFENMTRDIGKELKETARRIYVRSLWFLLITIIIETIVVIGAAFDSDEPFAYIMLLPFGILFECLIVMGAIHLITINLYAKGEIVHLLRKNGGNDAIEEAPVPAMPKTLDRSQVLGQLKKPKKDNPLKTPVNHKENIQKIAEKMFVQEKVTEPVHLDDTWICGSCGAENAMKYSQCKKCGKFKNS